MQQTWRWFGPDDKVSLADIRQAGATGIVTALHHLPPGAPWTAAEIATRQEQIRAGSDAALHWQVVESLPVSEEIKRQGPRMADDIAAYRASLKALAEAGLQVICYNFMPVLDWTRTDLRAPLAHGGRAMRFDLTRLAIFDIHILARAGAAEDYPEPVRADAARAFAAMNAAEVGDLARTVGAGLPGAAERHSLDGLRAALDAYSGIDTERLRRAHIDFLSEVVPLAEDLGLRLCCHPDDPPFPLLGLPRVVSTAADYSALFDAVDSPSAGMTFCSGSLGARPDNDCAAIARRFGPKIHFVHLRNVRRDTETVPCSFTEDAHLDGQTDMVAVIDALLEEEALRRTEGRTDTEIPMRPDHGQEILSDLTAGAQPGYPAIGRLKGLAELRGVMTALTARAQNRAA